MVNTAQQLPDATIIIPVNAKEHLEKVFEILDDISNYHGQYAFEVILVVNNYPPNDLPLHIEAYRSRKLRVIAIPDTHRPGEAPGFSARIPGIRAAVSENCILFDADCRIPNPTDLFDWYVKQLNAGADLAYTGVGHYELPPVAPVYIRIAIHYLTRWFKRALLCIPTNRGSNYAIRRAMTLRLYDQGMLADEMNVGPSIKAAKGKIVYSGRRKLRVLTSGNKFERSWRELFIYLAYRWQYNLNVLPVRTDAAKHTDWDKYEN